MVVVEIEVEIVLEQLIHVWDFQANYEKFRQINDDRVKIPLLLLF